ncbi:carbohydrate-binding module family 14 protein [Aestuariicoccus sp. MJ-SS9]|uniref:carbohydrate-binding module family 14 protein n=1 Tax=Aestuariicoccus sp. MJ-SS9 TaxID=3079855 RepID=UPI00290B7502|nr:carbohydrate-binding module family 14 protein [Aestuariicoccus sp. MJ-SS9]MDU8913624.1 carbohydrate-binding module family 14 protein [Aestuariicoccus sp. MJ-SS9]
MTIKTLVTAAALVVAPTFAAFASCSGHSQQAMTCADGTIYDAASNSCKVVSG